MLIVILWHWQTQKGIGFEEYHHKCRSIVAFSGMKFDMYTLFFSPTINTSDNTQAVNPLYQYRDSIEVVEDPTINALCGGLGNVMPWFLIGDPGDTDFIEVDYLNGQEIPNIRRMEAPGQLGFIWDIYPRLGYLRNGLPWKPAKKPQIKVDTKLKLGLRGRRNKSWQQQHSGREARLSMRRK